MTEYNSFSRISDYLSCPQLYKLKHLDKALPESSGLDLACGTALHMGVNEILQGEDGSTALIYWDSIKNDDLQKFSYSWEELKQCLEVWLSKFERLHSKHFEPILMEERLTSTIGGVEYQGTPDFYGKYKGVLAIGDWKTTTTRYIPEKIVADEQMVGYAKLLADNGHPMPEQSFYCVFVKDRKTPSIQNVLTRQLTGTNINSTITNIEAQVGEIKRGCFMKNTRNCVKGAFKCAAFDICHKE